MPQLYLKKLLNPSQFEAVTTIDGPLLVIAGAGSGKTRVIEYRVLNLIQSNIAPGSILLLTFTRKAAREMLSRAEKHDERCRHVEGGTFHSFAFKMLKRYAKVLGLSPSFSILDETDAEDAIHRCMSSLDLSETKKRFPKKNSLRNIISISINKAISIEAAIEKEYPHFLEYASHIERIRREYVTYKIGKNYVDYDDLLLYLKLLLEKEEVRCAVSQKYKYVMVDEYQDTNRLQGDITFFLARDNKNIMVVGDDAQSIYGFRGSSHENIMEFPERFPAAKVIKLEKNYRSVQPVLNIANNVLENMNNKYSKCLISVRSDATGEKPKLIFFKDIYQEAECLVGMIKDLNDNGESFTNIAILFRSAYISIPIQAELSRHHIPYQVFGGLKFYETAHVKDMIAHLRVIRNVKDEISWHRVLTLIDGIGEKIALMLSEDIIESSSLGKALDAVLSKHGKGFKYSKDLKRLAYAFKSAASFKLSAGAQYSLLLDYYTPLMKEKFDDWHLRINDLEALRQISQRYESLEDLLADFAIEPPERGVWGVNPKRRDDDKPLTLSTIHSAKGLEWKTVFLIGLVDGLLPISYALDDEGDIEEEARLFYVAITRAKDRLFLSLHHEGSRGGISQFNKISRFVNMPNVLAGLEHRVAFDPQGGEISLDGDAEDATSLSERDTLIKNMIESFE